MLFHKKSWISRHIITEHHAHMDALARWVLVSTVILLAGSFWFLQYQNRVAPLVVTLSHPARVTAGEPVETVIQIRNTGRAISGAILFNLVVGPEMTIDIRDPRYDASDGAVRISMLGHDAQTTVPVVLIGKTPGEYSLVASVLSEGDKKVLIETRSSLFVEAPVLSLGVRAQYFSAEGEQLGRGPLPPRVGETTRYFIAAFAPYKGTRWREIEMSATLGEHVVWTGFIPTDNKTVRYDASSRRVIWIVDAWPLENGEVIPTDLGAAFELALTPIGSDAGTPVRLLGPVSVSAIHQESEQRYSTTLLPVLSDPVSP